MFVEIRKWGFWRNFDHFLTIFNLRQHNQCAFSDHHALLDDHDTIVDDIMHPIVLVDANLTLDAILTLDANRCQS